MFSFFAIESHQATAVCRPRRDDIACSQLEPRGGGLVFQAQQQASNRAAAACVGGLGHFTVLLQRNKPHSNHSSDAPMRVISCEARSIVWARARPIRCPGRPGRTRTVATPLSCGSREHHHQPVAPPPGSLPGRRPPPRQPLAHCPVLTTCSWSSVVSASLAATKLSLADGHCQGLDDHAENIVHVVLNGRLVFDCLLVRA